MTEKKYRNPAGAIWISLAIMVGLLVISAAYWSVHAWFSFSGLGSRRKKLPPTGGGSIVICLAFSGPAVAWASFLIDRRCCISTGTSSVSSPRRNACCRITRSARHPARASLHQTLEAQTAPEPFWPLKNLLRAGPSLAVPPVLHLDPHFSTGQIGKTIQPALDGWCHRVSGKEHRNSQPIIAQKFICLSAKLS